jgi:hypothetical protein
MTDTSTTDRSQWTYTLDRLTSDHEGDLVVIEVLDTEFGDNEQAERVPFGYANYDRRDDAVIIGVGGRSGRYPVALRHMIWHPVEIDVDADALRVVDTDGTVTIVGFYSRDEQNG